MMGRQGVLAGITSLLEIIWFRDFPGGPVGAICTSTELGIGSIPGWTTKDLHAAGCSQKRQRDKKPNYYLDRGPKTGNHFRVFWDMKAFNHPDVTAKNQKWVLYDTILYYSIVDTILYERMCEWKRKMTRPPKEKKKEKTKYNTLFHVNMERINWRCELKKFLRQASI